MACKRKPILIGTLTTVALALPWVAFSDTLTVIENRVTSTSFYETTPTLGNDGVSDLVVYTSRELLNNGFFDQADIWYRRLNPDGSPLSAPVPIASGLTDDKLNDTSGDYVVYTAYDSTAASTGVIMLYQISTGQLQPISDALVIQEPRIHGDTVVWVQGAVGSSEVMVYDLAELGTSTPPESLTGPVPPVFNVDIGERFVVWVESSGDYDLGAYDLQNDIRIKLTDTATIDERHPATSGDWIVWESRRAGETNKRIEAVNLETGDYRIVADDGLAASRPSIDGDLILYESGTTVIPFDVYVHRLSTSETFAVTSDPDDQYLNDVRGDLAAYVKHDSSGGVYDEDVYVARLDFLRPGAFAAPGFQPSGLAYDGIDLYSADAGGFRTIYRLDPTTGAQLGSFLAPSPSGFDGNGTPSDLAYDGAGHLFVSDLGDDTTFTGVVYEIDTAGTTIFQSFPVPFRAGGLAFDGTHLYIADFDSTEVLVTDRYGVVERSFHAPVRPAGLTWDAGKGHLVAISQLDRQISKLGTDGSLLCSYEGPRDPGVQGLGGVAFVGAELYVAEVTDPDPFNPPEVPGTIFVVTQPNCAPLADAGPDPAAVHPGLAAGLDGSGSRDPDGDGIAAYSWRIASAPGGSAASLSDPAGVFTSLTPDYLGDYVVELVVTDGLGLESAPDSVLVSTFNTPPVAAAGSDQAVLLVNTQVQLDGTDSYDDEGDPITYSWSLSTPAGSGAFLSDPASATPTFVADVQGDYVGLLVVTDSFGASSAPDTVTVSFENVPPVADAGGGQAVLVGDAVFLDGSGSSDANGDPLAYAWELTSRPLGSAAALADPMSPQTTFVADAPGTFVVQLIVSDGLASSEPDTITVTAVASEQAAIDALLVAIDLINATGDDDFKNPNMRDTLVNKIGVVIGKIDDGKIDQALSKLRNDVLKKVNGCAETGAPDRNDWIVTCAAQQPIYEQIMAAIALLEG